VIFKKLREFIFNCVRLAQIKLSLRRGLSQNNLIYTTNPVLQKRGAIPDYDIPNSLQDVLVNRDAAMEFTLKNLFQIQTKSNKP